MRKRTQHFITVAVMLFGISILVPDILPQTKSFTLGQILRAIATINQASDRDKKTYYSKILNDIRQRRVDFPLTKENEDLLRNEGATAEFIDIIKKHSSPIVVPARTPIPNPATPLPTPIPTPALPDYSYFLKRGDASFEKGDFAVALVYYDEALELKAEDATIFVKRGRTHHNLNSFEKALADYNKSIDLDPKATMTYYNRGVSYEKMGDAQKAMADYQKALDLDKGNDLAKSSLTKIQDERAKAVAEVPKSIDLGNLTAVNAIKMVTPVYSSIAQRSNVGGRVTVEIELDEKGNVVSAKAVSGHQMLRSSAEDAARRSKFKPAMVGTQPVKARGSITYNFTR